MNSTFHAQFLAVPLEGMLQKYFMHLEAAAASIDYGDQALQALRAVEGHYAIWAILAGSRLPSESHTQVITRQELPHLTLTWSESD